MNLPATLTDENAAVGAAWACLLWTTPADSDDDPNFSGCLDGLDYPTPGPGVMMRLREYVGAFITEAVADLTEAGITAAQAGHDLILTANGHGTGFWDRGHGAIGERLSDAARKLGPVEAYRGDDGLIYVAGWEVTA